jgi:hypothetical protein
MGTIHTSFSAGPKAIFGLMAKMIEIDTAQLKEAIERMHGDLAGHPTSNRAYACSSLMEGSKKRRFFAPLHQSPVDSPQAAMRAAIMTERRKPE